MLSSRTSRKFEQKKSSRRSSVQSGNPCEASLKDGQSNNLGSFLGKVNVQFTPGKQLHEDADASECSSVCEVVIQVDLGLNKRAPPAATESERDLMPSFGTPVIKPCTFSLLRKRNRLEASDSQNADSPADYSQFEPSRRIRTPV